MKYFLGYLRLQLKRTFKSYLSIFIVTVVLLSGLILTAGMIMNVNDSGDNRQKVKIGLIGNVNEGYLGIGFYALKNIDESRFAIDFIEIKNENQAEKLLDSGEISAYIVIPDGFLDSIVNGENMQLKYVMNKSSASFASSLMGEVVRAVSALVTESQNAIFGMSDYAHDNGKTAGLGKKLDDMNIDYIEIVLRRSDMAETDFAASNGSELSLAAYYICAMLTLFFMIWGITCSPLFARDVIPLNKLLVSNGARPFALVLCEWLSFLIISMFTAVLIALFACFMLAESDFGVPELEYMTSADLTLFSVKLLPCIAMLTAMQFLLYEAASGIISGVLIQFVAAAGLGYITGCFYPSWFFPVSVQRISEMLPSGVAFRYIRLTFTGRPAVGTAIMCLIYAALFYILSLILRKYKIAAGRLK